MAGVIMTATQNPLLAFPAMLGIAGIAFGASRFGVKRYAAKKSRELRSAVERLAVRVREMTDAARVAASSDPRRLKR
jgi:hypothetical protein